MSDPFDPLRDFARRLPPKPGFVNSATASELFGPGSYLLVIDARGRVFQGFGVNVTGGALRYVSDAKTALLRMIEDLKIEDLPQIPPDLEA